MDYNSLNLKLCLMHTCPQLCIWVLHNKFYRRSKKVFAWTVDDTTSMQKMLYENVDAIVTGNPTLLQRLMQDMRTECLEEGFSFSRGDFNVWSTNHVYIHSWVFKGRHPYDPFLLCSVQSGTCLPIQSIDTIDHSIICIATFGNTILTKKITKSFKRLNSRNVINYYWGVGDLGAM